MEENKIVHIIDDQETIRESLSMILDSHGYQTFTYSNGKDFINQYQPAENECLILDLAMPEMNGDELFHYLKKENFQTAIIFLSGNADISTAVKVIKNGAIDFITKPFDPNNLIHATQEAINKTRIMKILKNKKLIFKNKFMKLTPKEKKIFFLMLQRKSIFQMADLLKRSESTIEKHRMSVLKKLEFSNTDKLIRYCEKNNIHQI